LDLERALSSLRTSIAQDGAATWEKDTKTHQQRRIALDDATVALLRAYRDCCEADAAELGIALSPTGVKTVPRRSSVGPVSRVDDGLVNACPAAADMLFTKAGTRLPFGCR